MMVLYSEKSFIIYNIVIIQIFIVPIKSIYIFMMEWNDNTYNRYSDRLKFLLAVFACTYHDSCIDVS